VALTRKSVQMAITETAAYLTDGENPVSSCRIHDLPQQQRPREKLAAHGPSTLTDDELLALFISSGMHGLSAIDIGRNLLKKFGSLGALGGISAAQLAQEKGLGMAKGSKLAAAFELGNRVAREQIHNHPLDTPAQLYALFGPQLSHLQHEQVRVIVLDARLHHIATETVSVGTVNETCAHPREIFKPVISRSGYGFILIHNHPSGNPYPSKSDKILTDLIVQGAEFLKIKMHDHIIIGRPAAGQRGYFSFREVGLIH
jgi:DNA repair protein RadC